MSKIPPALAGKVAPADAGQDEAGVPPLRVIPVVRSAKGQEHTLRVVDPRAAAKSAAALASRAAVSLDEQTCLRLAMSCVDLDDFHVTRHRANSGWLTIVECRQFVPMLSPTPSNDRLGSVLIYAADPQFSAKTHDESGRSVGHIAVPMAQSDGEHAQLVYKSTKSTLLEATDRNCQAVWEKNPQEDIGPDIIHRPLTSVFVTLRYTDGTPDVEEVTVDGNSRLASAYNQVWIDPMWLPQRLRMHYDLKTRYKLTPSMLMNCTLTERRDLTRIDPPGERKPPYPA